MVTSLRLLLSHKENAHVSHPILVRTDDLPLVAVSIIFTALLAGPASSAQAAAPVSTLLRAEFDAAPLGPLSGPLVVEQGTVVPQAGTVTIANGTSGRALKLESAAGQATALIQWSNYPGAIPTNSEER